MISLQKEQKWNFLENLEIIDYIADYVTKKAHQQLL